MYVSIFIFQFCCGSILRNLLSIRTGRIGASFSTCQWPGSSIPGTINSDTRYLVPQASGKESCGNSMMEIFYAWTAVAVAVLKVNFNSPQRSRIKVVRTRFRTIRAAGTAAYSRDDNKAASAKHSRYSRQHCSAVRSLPLLAAAPQQVCFPKKVLWVSALGCKKQ